MLGRCETAEDYLKQARQALMKNEAEKAVELAGKAIAADPKNGRGYPLARHGSRRAAASRRGRCRFEQVHRTRSVSCRSYQRRGGEQFKLGKIAESVAAFDRYLELRPEAAPGHWQRGISLYYAGKYDEGMKQFKGYEKVDTNDVENAVWHFLCARRDGIDKARAGLLKIGKDKRPPMMEVYALFQGEGKPADVLAAAQRDGLKEAERKQALFYAHLYLGLYYDATGDKAKALEHMTEAAGKYQIGHYMGDVAHVHEELLRKRR